MELSKKPWALPTICRMQNRIDPTPDYQRPPVWSRRQKQLLMDTILRGYDIPKFYWRSVKRTDGVQYEVIDGQQRLRSIWEFYNGEYPLAKDADPIDGHGVANLRYEDLAPEIMEIFDTYSIDVVVVTDAQEDTHEEEVRDMFLRLQNGTTLKAQEKRNAMTGAMRDFVRQIASHPFMENCRFNNSRFTFDHIAAQTILLELKGGASNIKDTDLNRLYSENTSFDVSGPKAKKIKRTYDFLLTAIPEKTPELERYSVIALHCIASKLLDKYVYTDLPVPLANWFIRFERVRRDEESKPEDDRDPVLTEYRRLTSQSTDSEESINARLAILERSFFLENPDIELKDQARGFSHEQRLAIYRRDGGICQLRVHCDGQKTSWDNWHADHILPHSKGGKSIVANGQVACPACHQSKGATV